MEPSEEPMNGPDHPKDQQHTPILKGKRTRRRHRQQSPIPFASMMTGSPTSGGGEIVDTDDDRSNNLIGSTSDDKSGVAAADALSPSTSVELFGESCTKEEEDMANCLILLAQGQSQRELQPAGNIIKAVHQEADPPQDPIKFNSKRYLLEGYCVYECKTCNKTFPSFQALGGHRASHKKPKMAAAAAVAADERPSNKQIVFLPTLSDEEEGELKKISTLSLLNHNSITYGANSTSTGNNKQPKIHECSICGAEFTSGQALGGHMRRHRSPTVAAMVTKLECDDNELPARPSNVNGSLTMLSLDLDLNLPAPDGGDDDDDSRENMFLISSERQHQSKQPPLLVSAPAIVDCRN